MPKVSGRKNKKAETKTRKPGAGRRLSRSSRGSARQSARKSSLKAERGLLEGTGAFLDAAFTRFVHLMVTYSLVAVTAFGLIGLLLLFAGGYFFNISGRLMAASEVMARNAGFEITAISVKGRTRTADIAILNALYSQKHGETLGQSLLHFDLGKAREKIEALGWVKHAAVTRLLPGTLHVSLQERRPAAIWQNEQDGTLFVVDPEGVRIEEVTGDAYAALPMIEESPDPSRAAEVIKTIERVTYNLSENPVPAQQSGPRIRLSRATAMRKQLVALTLREDRRWDMKFRDGFVAMLPEKDIGTAITRLARIYAQNPSFSDGFQYLDMRDPEAFYYKPRNDKATKDLSISG